MQSVHTLLKLAQLRWTGHVTRMPDERLPKKILYGELQIGKRSLGGQKMRYKESLKAFKDFNIPTESWEQIAQVRRKWRGLIRRGAGEYKAKRISEAEQKRAQRKGLIRRGGGEYEAKRISEAEQKRAQRKARAKRHQQSFLPQTSLVLSATGSLELRLVSSAILEHTNNNTSRI